MMPSEPGVFQALSALPKPLRPALARKLRAMADDELILAHRNSEWCGHAPILEEDIAFANLAQDELGHAVVWYALLQQLEGVEPDRLVYFRAPQAFRNARLLELPNGDWAFSMLRQYLFDSYEAMLLEALSQSVLTPLAQAAAKIRREEIYHLRHSSAWVQRLALGTDESQRRMQASLDNLWPACAQLFVPLEDESLLVQARVTPAPAQLASAWTQRVGDFLVECSLAVPPGDAGDGHLAGREVHTDHLPLLVEELQSVARLAPGASW